MLNNQLNISLNSIKLLIIIIPTLFILTVAPVLAEQFSQKNIDMWETTEWELNNINSNGNPFDLVGSVTFNHTGSNRSITTQMFYNGSTSWKFRFTGTKSGEWNFTTTSSIDGLNGHTGSINVSTNTNGLTGFMVNVGNRYALQTNDADELKPYEFNVFMDELEWFRPTVDKWAKFENEWSDIEDTTKRSVEYTRDNGFGVIFLHPNNNWFAYKNPRKDTHNSSNPDLKTFSIIERVIKQAHSMNARVHIWAWGDEARRWTPRGGINAEPAKRLQRYIAARLGPLPGWSMSYGFDLQEWVSASQVGEWAQYLRQHFGWDHLLMARGRNHPALKSVSYSQYSPVRFYDEAKRDLATNPSVPHIYEERFTKGRAGHYSDDQTRQLLWQYAMAGGMGSFWGFFPESPRPYKKKEQLRTHYTFWNEKNWLNSFNFSTSKNGNHYALTSSSRIIIYSEEATSIPLSFINKPGSYNIIAIDTRKSYSELNLGNGTSSTGSINLPYSSDWAVILSSGSTIQPTPIPPTAVPTNTPIPSPTETNIPIPVPPIPTAIPTSTTTPEPTVIPTLIPTIVSPTLVPTVIAIPTSTVPPTPTVNVVPTQPPSDTRVFLESAIEFMNEAKSIINDIPTVDNITEEEALEQLKLVFENLNVVKNSLDSLYKQFKNSSSEVTRSQKRKIDRALKTATRTISRRVIRSMERLFDRGGRRLVSLFTSDRSRNSMLRSVDRAISRISRTSKERLRRKRTRR